MSATIDPMARKSGHRGEKNDMGPFLLSLGPLTLWLKQKFVLPVVTFIGAVVAVFAPLVLTDAGWAPLRILAGVLAAISIVADRLADTYEKKLALITFRESERSAEKAVDDLNILLSEAIESMFLEGSARVEAIKALRRTLARQAVSSIGEGSRASYYPLRRGEGGTRILDRPLHATAHGRFDKPDRPFVEAETPLHEVWRILDRADEEPEVRSAPEVVGGVDWNNKKYDTFYSVPVKANMVQLGFLSVNNAKVGAIGGPQRAVVLAMARTMALVIAAQKGPKFLNSQAAYNRASEVAVSVGATTEEEL
jgi:hypothetical protein